MNKSRKHIDATQIDYAANQRKRLRVSRACDQCRQKRDKCDGQQPSCQGCIQGNRSCTYNQSTKKRGLPTGYVRGLEMMLGHIFCHIDGSEELMSSVFESEEATCLQSRREFLVKQQNAKPAQYTHRSAKSILASWRQSRVMKQMESFLLAADGTEDDETFMKRFDDKLAQLSLMISGSELAGKISNVNKSSTSLADSTSPNQHLLQTQDQREDFGNEIEVNMGDDCHLDFTEPFQSEVSSGLLRPDSGPPAHLDSIRERSPREPLSLSSTSLPQAQVDLNPSLPPYWSELIDIYLSRTHCWFPISQKYDLLRTVHCMADDISRGASNGQDQESTSPGDRAMVWAVLAYTSCQTDAAHLDFQVWPNNTGPGYSTAQLYAWAVQATEVAYPVQREPGHIRALLVLVLINVGRGRWTAAWEFIGQAIYAAVETGLIALEPQARPTYKRHTNESTRRTALGCFLLDTLVSSHLGRRPYLRRSDLQLIGFMDVNGNEEWEALPVTKTSEGSGSFHTRNQPGRILSTFNALLHLSGLLNDWVCNTALDDASSASLQDLEAWQAQLPSHCRSTSAEDDISSTPQQMNLRLAYSAIEAILKVQTMLTSSSDSVAATSFNRSHKTVSLISKIRHELGRMSLTPLTQVYLGFCSRSIAVLQRQHATINNAADGLIEKIDQLINEVEASWKSLEDIQTQTLQESSRLQPELLLTHSSTGGGIQHLSGPPLTPLSQVSSRPNFLNHPHSLPSNSSMAQPAMGAQLDELAKIDSMASLAPYDVTYDPFRAPLPDDQDGDALFSSLAMLDPVEWQVVALSNCSWLISIVCTGQSTKWSSCRTWDTCRE